jgi:glycosyltransferase involved in cell wall biosynthesis
VLFAVFKKVPFQVAYFRSARFNKKLNDKISTQNFDAIHIQHLRMAQYFSRVPANAILDLPDAFSLYWKRRASNARRIWMRLFAKIEYKRLLSYEQKCLPRFRLNLVCSEEDRDYLQANTTASLAVLPNGVDTDLFYPCAQSNIDSYRILFTGNMDYEPNVDAVEYFAEQIWPEIKKALPLARFVIAGQRPVARVRKLAGNDIEVTGFVPNMADEYAKARVVVAPLRFGAGTQNKVLEALAMGVPVVCTQVGFKGLGIKSGEGALLAETAAEFSEKVIALINSASEWEKVSGSGTNIISRRFSWDAVAGLLQSFFESNKA